MKTHFEVTNGEPRSFLCTPWRRWDWKCLTTWFRRVTCGNCKRILAARKKGEKS